ncbi:MAG TPA: DUF4157 domain-containing protein [Kofleriaceae bacterium]|nr:DUF4157 domain-containing protein [Kofleriaceae bacterium]
MLGNLVHHTVQPFAESSPVQRKAAVSTPAPVMPIGPRSTIHDRFGGGVQRKAANSEPSTAAAIHASAQRGVATSGASLPHLDTIQRAFGRYDVSGIQAHTGADAAASAREIGAQAYATGDHVVLGEGRDLHTVAHEAAHVVQQRGGVQLKGGVGEAEDAHEHHADAVADAVVQGRSAEGLLDRYADGAPATSVQRRVEKSKTPGQGPTADIENSALNGKAKERADEALQLADSNTSFADHPYVVRRTKENNGKTPRHIMSNFHWGETYANHEGSLPGVPGAGGYRAYYIMNDDDTKYSSTARLVIATDGNVFHTSTHYGSRGQPAFTHFRIK